MFDWFNTKEEEKFAYLLAETLIDRMDLTSLPSGNRLQGKKHDAMLHNLLQQVNIFKLEHKLNIYKKAQLGNAFKWALKDKGYDTDYVNQLTNWIMLKL